MGSFITWLVVVVVSVTLIAYILLVVIGVWAVIKSLIR